MTDQVAIAANPFSGAKKNRQLVDGLVEAVRAEGLEPIPMWEKGGLTEAFTEPGFAERTRCVIAAGGDGTLGYVINHQPPVPVAMFPIGNENLFARQYGYQQKAGFTAKLVAAGHQRVIDLGRSGDTRFSIVASAGFDGDVAHRLAQWRHRNPTKLRRVRRSTYARPILAAMVKYRFPVMNIEADDRKISGALVMAFNIPQYGLGLPLCPDASDNDGMLDWVVFEKPGRLRLTSYALSTVRGRHARRKDVQVGRSRRLKIESSEPVPIEVDGDPADHAPTVIEALPGALTILVPDS